MAISVVHTTASNTLATTIPSTTAGNCLIVCVGSFNNLAQASISGITLGGLADNFAQAVAGHSTNGSSGFNDAFVWCDPNCSGGKTSVVISGTDVRVDIADGGVVIYEVSGLAASSVVDKTSNGGAGTGTAWFSGTTATTTQANELWVGCVCSDPGISTLPGTPWNNTENTGNFAAAGQQVVSSTGTAVYNGTQSSSSVWVAVVATLNGAATSTVAPFAAPKVAKGKPAAVRGSGRGQKGAAYVAFPSAFQKPRKPARGAQAAVRGHAEGSPGAKYVHVIPPGPSPFTLPTRPAKGATAVRGTGRGRPGAAYVSSSRHPDSTVHPGRRDQPRAGRRFRSPAAARPGRALRSSSSRQHRSPGRRDQPRAGRRSRSPAAARPGRARGSSSSRQHRSPCRRDQPRARRRFRSPAAARPGRARGSSSSGQHRSPGRRDQPAAGPSPRADAARRARRPGTAPRSPPGSSSSPWPAPRAPTTTGTPSRRASWPPPA